MNEIITEYKRPWTCKRVETDLEMIITLHGNIDYIYIWQMVVRFEYIATIVHVQIFKVYRMPQHCKTTSRKLFYLKKQSIHVVWLTSYLTTPYVCLFCIHFL